MILPPECNSSFSEKLVDAMVEYEVDDNRGSSTLASELLDNTREFFTSGAEKFRSNFGERNYEERPQQSAMAQAVAKALTEGSNLCVEAPTGVGKSFAYLVPLFFRASQCALPALVSTGTITLQEQLLHKDIPLLKKVASTRKPVIMSVGMIQPDEISEAVAVLEENGCPEITLLKCTSVYPASPATTNLQTIPDLMKRFPQCRIGLSDHTLGIGVSLGAVALGAEVIEKHFTLSRADGGVDSAFSIEPAEMSRLVKEAGQVADARGQVNYELSE